MTDCFVRLGQKLGCVKKPALSDRKVYVGNTPFPGEDVSVLHTQRFPNNRVISSKYTVFNFLPKNLFEQFRRIANFYFLCVGIVQLIIDTPVTPITSIAPLVFVVSVTAIKQGYEDYLRHKGDNEVNNRMTQVIRDGCIKEIKSMNIKVGDIVMVEKNQEFPCDLVMLSSYDKEGQCYVTTANLDGETNLKTHLCISNTRKCQTVNDFQHLHAHIECQQPITDLYRFIGRITVTTNAGEEIKSLGPANVLLRGARLKNTPYIYGCAIYTGPETKMALNSKNKGTKFSRVERAMNSFLIIFLVVLLVESLTCTILKYVFVNQSVVKDKLWYVPDMDTESELTALRGIETFLSFMVLFNYFIPISMYVTVEIQKFVGSLYFGWDIEMYDEKMDQPAKANTSDLNEELGQVEYLFTDKTGTLTENEMQFRECSLGGDKYMEVDNILFEKKPGHDHGRPVTQMTKKMEDFFTVLALCHTIRVDHPHSDLTEKATDRKFDYLGMSYEYQSSSPDEKAFLEACRRYGIVLHGIHDDRLEVTFKGEMRRYKLFHVLEFDPTRKRMSVIIQNEQDEIYLLCKGAESAILDRVTPNLKEVTLQHVTDYALLGLRTLVLARRLLSPEEYSEIDRRLREARNSLSDREAKLEEVFEFIERDLVLLGATAVEDKLQDDVPDTIQSLQRSGIKVWVLTGDKEETAVNISYSAGHFKQGFAELRITQMTSTVQCAEVMTRLKNIKDHASIDQPFVLVVDGASLRFAVKDHSDLFRSLCQSCVAVLCCRMSPLQKAEVVKLIKNSKEKPVTAAIGDGANDVSMIQEAHVGLGIMGKEGRQAVRNSDYAFAKFRFLKRAILVHGNYYYTRLANLVQFFFYKNVAFITAQLFYTFFSGFSQQTIYDVMNLTMYNITFTSLPIFIYSLFEKSISQEELLQNPHLYKKNARNAALSFKSFIKWNFLGLWHRAVFFFGVYFVFGNEGSIFSDGKSAGTWAFGTVLFTTVVAGVNFKLVIMTYTWNLPMFLAYLVAILGNTAMTLFYSGLRMPMILDIQNYFFVFYETMSSALIWLTIILLVVLALLPDLIIRVFTDITKTLEDSHLRLSLLPCIQDTRIWPEDDYKDHS
ncbi:phospholipid-transporting ATPase IF [Mizuhopecten yessoensis]|uniref:Phospholipid-transporting ATPase n=1 Tax=Mizuhopecten yessoensis TaxID=6573 RepID=A0A210R0J4_MIZYE|nr:phospholipid-transporting ATPase IF [Mizuhopecten yessoensis]